MRVLAVTNMYPTSATPSAGTFVEQQIAGLRRAGVEVEVALVDRAGQGPARYLEGGRLVRQALARHRPQVVHVMYGGVLAALAVREASAHACVVSLCGTDLLGVEEGPPLLRARGRLGRACSLWAIARAQQVVVKSRNLWERLPQGFDTARASIIPNGVDVQRFQPMDQAASKRHLGWPLHELCVLHASHGPQDTNKRGDLVQAAIAVLRERGVAARLCAMSDVPHGDVPIWLNAADVVVMASRQEGSPNIVKEALACARPVVAVAVGDVAERLAGIAGCHLCRAEPGDMADKLHQVALGPRRVDVGGAMRELSLERVAERLVQVYSRAIQLWRAGTPPATAAGPWRHAP